MADKRIYQLDEISDISDMFVPLDKPGNTEAVRFSTNRIMTGEYTRCDEVVVTAGSDNIIEFSSEVPSSDFVILVAKLVMDDGTESVGVVSDKTVSGFRYTAYDDGTLLYYTTKKI
jgi:hypothetical protein